MPVAAPAGPPSYVLGLDEFGNIKHEIQPGQTIGHILLIYGYTWDEYPYLLEINGMSEADRLNMQPGDVILVPPQDGTYTPAPVATEVKASATAAPTISPTASASSTAKPVTEAAPTSSMRIHLATPAPATPQALREAESRANESANTTELLSAEPGDYWFSWESLGLASVAFVSRSR